MKTKNFTLLLLLLALLIFNILCNDNLLSKFHQNTYKIKDVRLELVRRNDSYFNLLNVKTFKYNRSTPCVNVTVNMKVTVEDKVEIVVQAFKFMSNEYRHFPLRFQVNFQKCFQANVIGFNNIKKCGNLTDFIFYKDITYHVCRFVIDENQFPPLIPNGRYKMQVIGMYLKDEIVVYDAFGEIYTPIAIPKH